MTARAWRWARRLTGAVFLLFLLAGGALYLTGLGAEIHVDPRATPGRSSPNWALAAPPGPPSRTSVPPTLAAPVWAATPEAALAALDAAVLAEPRAERVAAPAGAFGAGPLERVYLQRSALVGYPDYVSALAVDLSEGSAPKASLILYSRSVYGYSDMGVNDARVKRWLAAVDRRLGARPPE